ncbi:MAG TPA: hypothetical protein VEY11_17870 [Pyrinomonadaceae bacterium]|nr:hypothetical protein [Pyrinomonadaceae bacterium]
MRITITGGHGGVSLWTRADLPARASALCARAVITLPARIAVC